MTDLPLADDPILTLDHPAGQRILRPGDALAFGRTPAPDAPATDDDEPHLGLSANPRLHLRAGLIEVDAAGWVLTNTGRWLHLRVVEHGGPNRLDLQPGRAARIPYARCRVEVTTGDESVGFDADCPFLDRSTAPGSVLSGSTVQGLGLDRDAGYYRAVVALCAPRLRDPQSDEVASVGEIVRALNASAAEPERVTAKAVERRLAHVRRKLGIGASDAYGGSAAGLEVRDAARLLADLVLRTGAVTAEDLARLDGAADDPGDDPDGDPGQGTAGEGVPHQGTAGEGAAGEGAADEGAAGEGVP